MLDLIGRIVEFSGEVLLVLFVMFWMVILSIVITGIIDQNIQKKRLEDGTL